MATKESKRFQDGYAHMDYVQRPARPTECCEWQPAAFRVAAPCRALENPQGSWRERAWRTA